MKIDCELGVPLTGLPYMLYVNRGEYINLTIGHYCKDAKAFHTLMGEVNPDTVVAYIGPIPEPHEVLGQMRN